VKSYWNLAVGACVGVAVGFVVRGLVGGGAAPPGTPLKPAAAAARRDAPQQQAGADPIYKVIVSAAPSKGDPDAKVTIVEFSDFQCPYCGRGWDLIRQVEKAYGEDVRIVFKNNPLPIHPEAPFAARAALAAGRQGKFWEMHDKLFQRNFEAVQSRQEVHFPQNVVEQMATDIGLDLAQWKKDVNAPEWKDLIDSDQAQARTLGAYGTPYFYVNGALVRGAQPFETLRTTIDAAKKRADEALAKGVSRKDLYDYLIKDGQLAPPPQQQQNAPPPPPSARNVDPGSGPVMGPKNAKVTIVEFSDFQCPYCGRVEPTLKQIFDTYKGDVRLVWRNEPLSFHPNALPAAKAAMAAHKQGKFWAMHELMFAHQPELSEAKYEEWAKQIGLDVGRWKKDKESPEIKAQIDKDTAYAQEVGANGTPAFFINGKFISGAMPFETFKAIMDEQVQKAHDLLKKGVRPEKLYETIVAENVRAAGATGDATKIDVGRAPALGPSSAPVTIVEFSDFQCPYCGHVEPTLQQLRDDYQGRIKIVWKNQPLPFHPNAMPAAEAAMAAYEQGNEKFWAFHDKLFAHQGELGPAFYDDAAKQVGLDLDKFHASIESHRNAAAIQADMAAGNAAGANGTPTFFINGHKLVGAAPIEQFKQTIDAELSAQVANK
jgi:protein-disulfide isomerase